MDRSRSSQIDSTARKVSSSLASAWLSATYCLVKAIRRASFRGGKIQKDPRTSFVCHCFFIFGEKCEEINSKPASNKNN